MNLKKSTYSKDEVKHKVEEVLKRRYHERGTSFSQADMIKLIHELDEHQKELELHNEELVAARAEIQEAINKYRHLYDFAPIGYFTLDENGKIEESNFYASSMLGKERSDLRNNPLTLYFSDESKPKFLQFLKKVFCSKTVQTCELTIHCSSKSTCSVHLTGNISQNEKNCLLTMVDITEKKQSQKNILTKILQTEEKDKTHFSNAIHDGLGPLLSAIRLYLQLAQKSSNKSLRDSNIQEALNLVESAYKTVNNISDKLSPHLLQDYGLTAAMQNFISKIQKNCPINIHLKSNAIRRFDVKIEVVFYRALIECITNTVKHTIAKNIYININDDGKKLNLRYKDDGQGFEIEKALTHQKGNGLFNIRNRILTMDGEINMISEPGQGVDYQIAVNL